MSTAKQIYRYSTEVSNALTDEVLAAGDLPDLERYRQEIELDETSDGTIDLDLLDALLEYAIDLVLDRNALDGWLAPRLHNVIRVSRRIASDQGFWTWLALEHGRPYVKARFGDETQDTVRQWRYTGTWSRNALSRLWWGAEMTRNGSDYSIVPHTFGRVRTAQFALELRYSWYRPAAIAFVKVAEGLDDGAELPDGGHPLSTKINALIPLRPIEAIGRDGFGGEYDFDWRQNTPILSELTASELPIGPSDGVADDEAIDSITKWFREIASAEEGARVGA